MAAELSRRPTEAVDRRFMAAAIRLSRKHAGLTSTNPSVGTLIVRDDGAGPVIVGRGVTAIGGRPHAETEALAEAGELARGATAYVTLEPCAHHGRTPPCADALVTAGVARVVGAASDPDPRVSGKGYAILRAAGIEVVESVLADEAADADGRLSDSISEEAAGSDSEACGFQRRHDRPARARARSRSPARLRAAQVHLMRAEADAILVGIGTALADDPELTVRLPGLESRSPARIVLDRQARLPLTLEAGRDGARRAAAGRGLRRGRSGAAGRRWSAPACGFLATETYRRPRRAAGTAGGSGGAGHVERAGRGRRRRRRSAFLDEGLVDRIVLFRGAVVIGEGGIAAPIDADHMPAGFALMREGDFGDDRCRRMDKGRSDVHRHRHRYRHGRVASSRCRRACGCASRPPTTRRPSPSAPRSPAPASA